MLFCVLITCVVYNFCYNSVKLVGFMRCYRTKKTVEFLKGGVSEKGKYCSQDHKFVWFVANLTMML